MGVSPEGLMQKLEEEVKVNMYIVRDRLPKELDNRQGGPSFQRQELIRKIPRNRLGTSSVFPRKKVLIPRHSEVYGRVYSEARNGGKWHEKN
jgi:hypothetical protein